MTETVLFVCDDNSILAPMAESFLRRHCRSAFKVYSAGIVPRPIHLFTLQVMEEVGHEIYNTHVNSIFDLNYLQHVDYLITLTDYVRDHFSFNESNIGNHLHWPFRLPLLEPGQAGLPLRYDSLALPGHHLLLGSTSLKTMQEINLQVQVEDDKPKDLAEIRTRFRRTRDEIEVQVMNWLEEKGIGPLWWRGK